MSKASDWDLSDWDQPVAAWSVYTVAKWQPTMEILVQMSLLRARTCLSRCPSTGVDGLFFLPERERLQSANRIKSQAGRQKPSTRANHL